MTPSREQYRAYSNAMQTMAGTRQVVMLYDGILKNLHQAKEAMAEKRIEDRFNSLTRASEIIFGLQSCLDFEQGEEVASILYNFYSSVDARLFKLHRTNDVAECQAIIEEVKQMRDVWLDIDKGDSKAEASPADASEPDLTDAEIVYEGTSAPTPAAKPSTDNKPGDNGGGGVAISA